MPHQVAPAHPALPHVAFQLQHRVQLVVARKDQLAGFVDEQIVADDPQQHAPFQRFLPHVVRRVLPRFDGIPRPALRRAPVERQELRARPVQPRRRERLELVQHQIDQRPPVETEYLLPRVARAAELPHALHPGALPRRALLQLDHRHGNPVQEKRQIHPARVRLLFVDELPPHGKHVALQRPRAEILDARGEVRRRELRAARVILHPPLQRLQQAVLLDRVVPELQQAFAPLRAVRRPELRQFRRLRLLQELRQPRPVQRMAEIVILPPPLHVAPRRQGAENLVPERILFQVVARHRPARFLSRCPRLGSVEIYQSLPGRGKPYTATFPVTASHIRLARYSFNFATSPAFAAITRSISPQRASRCAAICCCSLG